MIAIGINGCGGGGSSDPVTPTPTPAPAPPPTPAPTVTPSATVIDRSVFEPGSGSSAVGLTVTLSEASTNTITIDYATAGVTATMGADFTSASGTLSFAPGETSKTISVNVLADTPFDERDETFTVALTNPGNATLARAQATVTIVDKVSNPDTGITTCANETNNLLACPQTGFDQQDAEYGLDNTNNNNADGRAGFSYTKLDSTGAALAASAVTWSCVRDDVTGLVWEIKTNDGGLRDRDNTFTWYNPDAATNGGDAGAQNGGTCTGGISCNTSAYVAAVNAAGLCGANDWRMPTASELLMLHDFGTTTPPAIDTGYFYDAVITSSLTYWASDSDVWNATSAWMIDYAIGPAGSGAPGSKAGFPSLVRLVRNQ